LLKIPTIGIGAGPGVSGQVLVYQDMIGLNPGFKPKFLRTYANAFDIIQAALNAYDHDVKSGSFPNDSESYSQIHLVQPRTGMTQGFSLDRRLS
jgi:3-methyl-2-oxobutanoate hydroxymethyltransferase